MSSPTDIEQHPDIAALRSRYERAGSTPAANAMQCLAVLTGLYLAASPWIAGFNGLTTLAVTNLIIGIAYALLALGFGSAFERTHAMGWVAAALGLWTIIAPWVVAGNVDTARSISSNVITGAIALLLGLATVALGHGSDRHMGMGSGGESRHKDMRTRQSRPPEAGYRS